MGEYKDVVETENILSGGELRNFWVSWKNGFIQVGYGWVFGRDRFMSWQDPEPRTVHHVTFSSGWGHSGHWEVDSYTGRYCNNIRQSIMVQ